MLPYTAVDMLRVMRRAGEADADAGADDRPDDQGRIRIPAAPARRPHDSDDGPGLELPRLRPARDSGLATG